MTKLSSDILARIQSQHLHPVPRWHFVLRNAVLWGASFVFVAAAALSLGALMAELVQTEWSIAPRFPGGYLGMLYDIAFVFWGGSALLALVGGYLAFRFTQRGYRYGALILGGIVVGSGISAGVLLMLTPLPPFMHELHEEFLPSYIDAQRSHAPAEGRLLGEITSLSQDTAYLEAIDGTLWELWLFDDWFFPPEGLVAVYGEQMDASTFAVLAVQPVPDRKMVQDIPELRRMLP